MLQNGPLNRAGDWPITISWDIFFKCANTWTIRKNIIIMLYYSVAIVVFVVGETERSSGHPRVVVGG